MARGRKVADVYVEATLDKDGLRRGVRDIPRDVGPDADRAGRDLGDKVGRGLAASVESWSAKIAKARRAEQVAAQGVTLAETRLNEARAKGIGDGSRLLALEQQLERAKWKLTDANKAATTAVSKHTEAQRKLAESLTMVGKDLGPVAQRSGEDAGGKLALGMRMSIIRNSPLIVAAVAGGLTAGAPLVATAATGLFAGIGIVSAAQSDEVRQAWLGTWERVKDGAVENARSIEPVLIGLADRVGDGFERLGPRLGRVFEDTAPQIGVFADGVLGLAENALPGFERAIHRGMPVTRGFAEFLEKTGTGLTGMLDGISSRTPAVGAAFSMWGDTFGTLLPMLGELLGQGAELATIVLPALNGTLGVTLGVLTSLGPVLPAVITGLLGLKAAKTATGWIGGLAEKITALDTGSGKARGALDKVSAAMTPVNVVGGALAVTVGLLAAVTQDSDEQTRRWAEGLNQGGDAAKRARSEMDQHRSAVEQASTGLTGFALSMTAAGAATAIYADDIDKSNQAHNDWLASLTPLEQAQRRVAIETENLERVLGDENAKTGDVEAAKRRLSAAAAEEARVQGEVELATRGVTEAMLAQADQALASIDAGFAHRLSVDRLEDAQATLAETIRNRTNADKDLRTSEEDVARAMLDVEQALFRSATAAAEAKVSMSDLEAGTAEYDRRIQNETLGALYAMREGLDPQMRAAVDSMIGSLERGGASLAELGDTTVAPKVELDPRLFTTAMAGANTLLDSFGIRTAVPKADLDPSLFAGKHATAMAQTDNLDSQTPTPTAALNDAALVASYGRDVGLMATLGRQQPTPTARLNAAPFGSVADWVGGRLNVMNGSTATPRVYAVADVANAERHLAWVARNRTVTIWTNTVTDRKAGGPVIKAATGRRVVGRGGPFDDLVPAEGPGGTRYRLSNGEWIIGNAAIARLERAFGAGIMPLINTGRVPVVRPTVTPRTPRGTATASVASSTMQPASDIRGMGSAGQPINLHVTFTGTGMGADRSSMRRAAEMLRDELRKLDRELAR